MPVSLRSHLFPKKRLAELETLAFLADVPRDVAKQALEAEQRGQLSSAGADVFAATGEYWRGVRRTSGGRWDERPLTPAEHKALDLRAAAAAEARHADTKRIWAERAASAERGQAARAAGPPSLVAIRCGALDRVGAEIDRAVADKVVTTSESDAILRSAVGNDVTTEALQQMRGWVDALREHIGTVGNNQWEPYTRAGAALKELIVEVPRDIRGLEGSGLSLDVAANDAGRRRSFLDALRGTGGTGHRVEIAGTAIRDARLELRLGGREVAVDIAAGTSAVDVTKALSAALKAVAGDLHGSARRMAWYEGLPSDHDAVNVARSGTTIHLEAYRATRHGG